MNGFTLLNLSKNERVYDQIASEIQLNLNTLQEAIGKEDSKTLHEMGLNVDVRVKQRIDSMRQKVCDLSAETITRIEVLMRDNLPLKSGIYLLQMDKVDGNRPNRRMSAFEYFVNTCIEEKRNPVGIVEFAELSVKCCIKWNSMTAKDEKRFEDMADQDKMRYDQEMENYVQTYDKGVKRKANDLNAPKRSLSAFLIFCNEFREGIKQANPDFFIGDIAKALGKQWQQTDIKTKYESLAKKDQERYEKEMAAYISGGASSPKKSKAPPKEKVIEVEEGEEYEEEEEEDEFEVDEEVEKRRMYKRLSNRKRMKKRKKMKKMMEMMEMMK